mmetsp:Transcript_35016/g.103716  ORF Transcript_35016/g.103716 Transcript_35016/m.103716 type:complete len:334 (-) Transcript_35016:222-1223(-)
MSFSSASVKALASSCICRSSRASFELYAAWVRACHSWELTVSWMDCTRCFTASGWLSSSLQRLHMHVKPYAPLRYWRRRCAGVIAISWRYDTVTSLPLSIALLARMTKRSPTSVADVLGAQLWLSSAYSGHRPTYAESSSWRASHAAKSRCSWPYALNFTTASSLREFELATVDLPGAAAPPCIMVSADGGWLTLESACLSPKPLQVAKAGSRAATGFAPKPLAAAFAFAAAFLTCASALKNWSSGTTWLVDPTVPSYRSEMRWLPASDSCAASRACSSCSGRKSVPTGAVWKATGDDTMTTSPGAMFAVAKIARPPPGALTSVIGPAPGGGR